MKNEKEGGKSTQKIIENDIKLCGGYGIVHTLNPYSKKI
jgi:hypothetical protein